MSRSVHTSDAPESSHLGQAGSVTKASMSRSEASHAEQVGSVMKASQPRSVADPVPISGAPNQGHTS
ncbi:hypothetical protein Lal_00028810 [Lupinus albus]|uniref:Uncharacterized protein n=1 Tax=Lupinus albus TaxID=3870 RepID=A0A6A4NRQ2_LUPAL|nr:hypothetical protein Lalb_Chr19g0139501 [Lupinus albus]KAF1884921.1 hypothetical protein Lal_00028810 [Lupinus albus]